MKQKTFLATLCIAALSLFTSCSNEESQELFDETFPDETFVMTMKYAGETYIVPCKLENDSLMYLDEEFNKIYIEEISKLPEQAMLTYKDKFGNDVCEFYKSTEELESMNGIVSSCAESQPYNNNPHSRVTDLPGNIVIEEGGILGHLQLFDDTNYHSTVLSFNIGYKRITAVPSIKGEFYINGYCYQNFNDKTSSIKLYSFLDPNKIYELNVKYFNDTSYPGVIHKYYGQNMRVCFIGYEDTNYKGKALYCISNDDPTIVHGDWKLKNIGWNDKISSFKFGLITYDKTIGSNPEFPPHEPIK